MSNDNIDNKKHGINPDSLTDAEFSRILKERLPEAPGDEWFVRKTMNRLPETGHRRGGSMLSWICYIIAAIGVIAGCGYGLKTYLADPVSTTGMVALLMTPVAAIFCLGVIGVPALRRISE